MITVYIAGPIMGAPGSEPFGNVGNMIAAGDDVAELGLCPFIPGLAALWAMQRERSRQFWLMWSMVWLEKCDAVYRIGGESTGADLETDHAEKMGIPVFVDLAKLKAWADTPHREYVTHTEERHGFTSTTRYLVDAPTVGGEPVGRRPAPRRAPQVDDVIACPDCNGKGRRAPTLASGSVRSFVLTRCETCDGVGSVVIGPKEGDDR